MFAERHCPRYFLKSAPVSAECLQGIISLFLLVSSPAVCHVWHCQGVLCAVGALTVTRKCGATIEGKIMRPPCLTLEVKSGAMWERPAMLVIPLSS